jgi:hypothetical protein
LNLLFLPSFHFLNQSPLLVLLRFDHFSRGPIV